jgi:hypothetical protein
MIDDWNAAKIRAKQMPKFVLWNIVPPHPVSGCKPWRRLAEYGNKEVNGGLVNDDLVNGQWWFSEWSMVNGENSNILLFLNQNANSNSTLSVFSFKFSVKLTSTLSVFSYQFRLLVRNIRVPLLPIAHSPLTLRLRSRRALPPTPSAVVNPDGG